MEGVAILVQEMVGKVAKMRNQINTSSQLEMPTIEYGGKSLDEKIGNMPYGRFLRDMIYLQTVGYCQDILIDIIWVE